MEVGAQGTGPLDKSGAGCSSTDDRKRNVKSRYGDKHQLWERELTTLQSNRRRSTG